MRKAIFAAAVMLLLGVGSVALADHGHHWPRSADSGVGWSTLADYRDGSRQARTDARVSILEEVLAEMVAEGTLAQVQADMIVTALEAKRTEMLEARHQAKEMLELYWEDGILTEDEINQLPMAERILQMEGVSEALADGQITKDEMRELHPGKRGGHHGGGRGHGRGHH